MLLLEVPYEEKDEAKKLGAKWDLNLKKWYVENSKDYPKFEKWISINSFDSIIALDHIYIAETTRECFKCKKPTKVIALCVDTYYELSINEDEEKIENFELIENNYKIVQIFDPLEFPKSFVDYINKEYNFKVGYSKTTEDKCFSNHCQNCNSLQGDFFLFNEPDSPLIINSKEKAENLILHKIKLKYDLPLISDEVVMIEIGQYEKPSNLISKYSKFDNSNITI